MIAIKQSFRHNPSRGIHGDCHRAAIASIFELHLNEVPHFGEGCPTVQEFNRRVDLWLGLRNLTFVMVPFSGSMAEVLFTLRSCARDSYYLLGGTNSAGVNHTVVGHGGEILHNPSPVREQLVGPCDDGLFWATFFVLKYPEQYQPPMLVKSNPARHGLWAHILNFFRP